VQCHLRLRYLHGDTKCPICKAVNEQLIVSATKEKAFHEYSIWGNEAGADFYYHEPVGMFFPKSYYETEIQPLFGYQCTVKGCVYINNGGTGASSQNGKATSAYNNNSNDNDQTRNNNNHNQPLQLRALQDHLRNNHRLQLCTLCTNHKRDFIARLPRFTPAQLQRHFKSGDGPTSGFDGHPVCDFCAPTRFYDVSALYVHLAKDHYKCHVCEKVGLDNQFFKHYASLAAHFARLHYACANPQCVEARFVVFANELDLRHHERTVHGNDAASSDSKLLRLEFRVRRSTNAQVANQVVPDESDFQYGLDGEAFVPPALPVISNDDVLHPLHVQRTADLREQAAAMRMEEEDVFPTLEQATVQQNRLQVGWTEGTTLKKVGRKNLGIASAEDFPALPPAKPKVNTRIRATASSASGGWNGGATTVAAAPATFAAPTRNSTGANLTLDNFPSLGPGQQRQNYAAANALTKTMQAKPHNLSVDNFPALAPTSASAPPPQLKAAPPVLDSVADFPAPPRISQNNKLRHQLNSVTTIPTQASIATVDEIKAVLGPNYKQMKQFTREFVAGSLEPEGFVDRAATLFDQGYADPHFWSFLPNLLVSCPDLYASAKAVRYMDSLKHLSASSSAVSNNSLTPLPVFAAEATPSLQPAAQQWSAPQHAAQNTIASRTNSRSIPPPTGRTKSAWGAGRAPALLRAKASSPGLASVANAKPQIGTASKGMAKIQKQEKQQAHHATNNGGGTKKGGGGNNKKTKEKNELRNLAFGA
jgi:hypothetical protein